MWLWNWVHDGVLSVTSSLGRTFGVGATDLLRLYHTR
jgi:hypothetical protein